MLTDSTVCLTDCRLAVSKHPEGPASDQLNTGWFSWISCVPASAHTVPNIPSCHCMLLTQPSQLKFTKINSLDLKKREVN